MLPVVVGSHPDSPWIDDCLTSILATTDRQVIVHSNGGYEPAALRTGAALFDRFVYLQDSVTILSPTFWDAIGDAPCWFAGNPPMFLGIHDSTITALLPRSASKKEAIALESELPGRLDYPTVWPTVTDRTALRREFKHGRDNLVLGNEHFLKWKGTWA